MSLKAILWLALLIPIYSFGKINLSPYEMKWLNQLNTNKYDIATDRPPYELVDHLDTYTGVTGDFQLVTAVLIDWSFLTNIFSVYRVENEEELTSFNGGRLAIKNVVGKKWQTLQYWAFCLILLMVSALVFYVFRRRYSITIKSKVIQTQNQESDELHYPPMIFEGLFSKLFESSFDAQLIIRNEYIVSVNKKVLELLEVTSSDVIGKKPYDFSPELQPDGLVSAEKGIGLFNQAMEKGSVTFEWLHTKNKSHENILCEINLSCIPFEDDIFYTAIIHDVTLEKALKREIDNHQKNLELLVDEKTQKLGESYQKLAAANEELQASNEEFFAINQELEITNQLLYKEIEDHKKTLSEKQVLEEELKQFISQSYDAISITNEKGEILEWNYAIEQLTGITKSEALGMSIWDIEFKSMPETRQIDDIYGRIKTAFQSYLSDLGKRYTSTIEGELLSFYGEKVYVQTNYFPIVTNHGNYLGIITRNITQHKKDEQKLKDYQKELEILLEKQSERVMQISERFNEVFNSTSDVIMFTDIMDDGHTFKIVEVNHAAKALYGITDEQLEKGLYTNQIMFKENLQDFETNYLPSLIRGETVVILNTVFEGVKTHYWQTNAIPIKNHYGKVHRIATFSKNITAEYEYQLALEKIKINEQNYRFLEESIEDVIWTFDIQTQKLLYISPSNIKLTGYSADEALNLPLDKIVLPDHLNYLLQELQSRVSEFNNGNENARVRSYEYQMYHKNGTTLWAEMNTTLIKSSDGLTKELIATTRNINDRKLTENALRESEERFASAFKSSPTPFVLSEIDTGEIIDINDSWIEKLGFSREEQIGFSTLKLGVWFNPSDRQEIVDKIHQLGTFYNVPVKFKNKQGDILNLLTSATTILWKGKKVLLLQFLDETERYKMIEALTESENRFRYIARLSKNIVYDYDMLTGKIIWDGAIEEVTGFLPEEYQNVGFNEWADMIHPEDKERALQLFYESMNRNIPYKAIYRLQTKNHTYNWVEEDTHIVSFANNRPSRLLGAMRDITERYIFQNELEKSERKTKTIFNLSKNMIMLLNKDYQIIDANDTAIERSGSARENTINKNVFNFILPEMQERTKVWFNSAWINNKVDDFETTYLNLLGKRFFVELSAQQIEFDKSEFLLLIISDITHRTELEQALLKSVINTEEKERLLFSQELHDGLGPVISAIKMYTEWLLSPEPIDNSVKLNIVSDIHSLVNEASDTVREISFKLSPHILQNYGLIEAIKAYIEKIKLSSKILFVTQFSPIDRLNEINETIAYRVICECINNTIKHAKASEIGIRIETSDATVVIEYSDNGIGFNINDVFEQHKGIGLLNMVSRIKSINGSLNFNKREQTGLFILIKIPMV